GRPDIVNAGSGGGARYSECRVQGDRIYSEPDVGSGETRYSECQVRGDRI
ncbi:unnamed protein product, partial [Staurois parvus]